MGGQSSARPANLDSFAARSNSLDSALQDRHDSLSGALSSFQANNQWGSFDASGLLANGARFISLNREDSRWVRTVANAFRQADNSGDVSFATDAQIQAALTKAGFDGSGRPDIRVNAAVATGGMQTTGYSNDPVSAASGNFIEAEVDLAFGPTLRWLQVRRTYNSLDGRTGPFGPGWASWASCRLVRSGDDTTVDWRGPDGQAATVDLREGTVPGFEGVIRADGDGFVAEFALEGLEWRFDAHGRPVQITEGPGTRVSLTWEGERLVGMAHERGRTVRYEWAGERIVAAIADDGRRVAYGYDDTGRLVDVDAPQGRRAYEVDDAGRVVTVIDGDGVVHARNTYDDRGRVLTQATPFGRVVRFHYLPGVVTVVDDDAGGPSNAYEHDEWGRLVRVTDGHGKSITRQYDHLGRVVAVTDRNGATTRYGWDDLGRQVRLEQPDGVVVDTVFDERHRPVQVTASAQGAEQAVTRFAHSGAERTPSEIIDPEGGVTLLDVDAGLVRRVVDPDGVVVRLDYDDEGRCVGVTDGSGATRAFEWDVAGQLVAVTSPLGHRVELDRDAAGRVVQRREPDGATWHFEHSAAGRLLAAVDPTGARRERRLGSHGEAEAEVNPMGAVTQRRWDQFGNVVSTVLPDGGKWQVDYDALMRAVGVTDPSGATWLREFDAEGRLVGTFTPDGVHRSAMVDGLGRVVDVDDGLTSVRFEYDAMGRAVAQVRPDNTRASATYDRCGRMVSVVEPGGGTTRFTYSPAGRLVEVNGPEGGSATYRYDEAGRLVESVDPVGARRRLRYDPDGRVVAVIGPTGERTRYAYDPAGRPVAVTDPAGGVTRYEYDLAGRVTAVTDPVGATVRYRYDPAGRPVAVTDPLGGELTFERDVLGRVVAEVDQLGHRRSYRLDECGRVLEATDPLGRATTFTYDGSRRLVRRLDPDGRRWRWWYDASDRVTAWGVDGEQSVRLHRDLLGRVVRVEEDDWTVSRTWDGDGNLVAESSPAGEMAWRYDRAGRRTAFAANGVETTVDVDPAGRWAAWHDAAAGTVRCERDADGRPVTVTGDGWREDRAWSDGRLVSWSRDRTGAGTRHMSFAHDAAGRVVSETDDGAEVSYGYDAAGQLRSAVSPAGSREFTYDAVGRLAAETGPAGGRTFTYDAAGQLDTVDAPAGRTEVSWDAAGRRISEQGPEGVRTCAWDRLGRWAGLSSTTPDGVVNERQVRVDPLGRLAEVDGTGLLWDPTSTVSELRAVGDQRILGLGGPAGVAGPDGAVAWLDLDARGTTGPADPWGTAAGQPAVSLPAGLGLGMRGELDVDGLAWLRSRVYDPGTRGFLTPDPLPGVAGTVCAANPYHYAGNDPIGSADPLGLRPVTEAELDKIRADWSKGAWDRYGGYVVGGLMIVGGVALMATGVGGVAGAMMVGAAFSGGISAIRQQAGGGVNWGRVGVDMVVGAAAGGAGAVVGGATSSVLPQTMNTLGRGLAIGAADGMAGGMAARTLYGENPLDPQGLAIDTLTGGTVGAAGARLGARNPSLRGANGTADSVNATNPFVIQQPRTGQFTAEEVGQVRQYASVMNDRIRSGTMSPTGRITVDEDLRAEANAAARNARAADPAAYDGQVAAHLPDTTWTGDPTGPFAPHTARVNSSIGAQSRWYPVGYRPSGAYWVDDLPTGAPPADVPYRPVGIGGLVGSFYGPAGP